MLNSDLKLLISKSEKFLGTAKLVFDNKDYESAVSRIYYAMFYMVKALLLTKNIEPKSHSGINAKFSEKFIKTGLLPKYLGKQYKDAFDKRLQGDYEIAFALNPKEVEDFLEIGKEFVRTLIEYLKKNNFL